ncbi:acyl-CoA dehydrogenase family protein [Streptomyces sp. NPDC005727]|uniref:acyl-CoA dehydrogenase family protein n=1 Tax=Streptomyces sp. NPDC005727 TaxID=3157053 RepID=UPI0033DA7FF4
MPLFPSVSQSPGLCHGARPRQRCRPPKTRTDDPRAGALSVSTRPQAPSSRPALRQPAFPALRRLSPHCDAASVSAPAPVQPGPDPGRGFGYSTAGASGRATVRAPTARMRTRNVRTAYGTAVAYAKERHQFGRPIGSFQAVKHTLADRHAQTDAARLLVHWAATTGDPDAARLAVQAAGDAADAASADNLQTHGGMGFTWEASARVLLKRARARRALLGTSARQLDAIAGPFLDGRAPAADRAGVSSWPSSAASARPA